MGGPPGEETSALSAGEHCSIPGWQEGPFFGLVDQVRREAALRLGALVFAGDCKVRCGLSSLLSPVFKEGLIKSERLISLVLRKMPAAFQVKWYRECQVGESVFHEHCGLTVEWPEVQEAGGSHQWLKMREAEHCPVVSGLLSVTISPLLFLSLTYGIHCTNLYVVS